jgi:hypothetical protein
MMYMYDFIVIIVLSILPRITMLHRDVQDSATKYYESRRTAVREVNARAYTCTEQSLVSRVDVSVTRVPAHAVYFARR